MTSTEERAAETRSAARVLLIDAADRVLLYRGFDPAEPDVRYWFTVGGGLDEGESPAEAASRELAEEAGLVVPPRDLGDPVFANVTEFSFAGRKFRQQQDFFLYRVERWDVSTDGFDQWERDHRRPPMVDDRRTGGHVRTGLSGGARRHPAATAGGLMLEPPRTIVRREAGLYALEQALNRRGFAMVAGADEAGRGACAGPLVIGAAILPIGRRGEVDELADSKLLTAAARDRVYDRVIKQALAYAVIVIPPGDIDERGLHVCNLAGMRRALASLSVSPEYVLTDGFPVDGLGVPGLAVWKGDQVAACVAAASVIAKVTRDRIMCELGEVHPEYGFGEHKGYSTPEHQAALIEHGPCPHHRFSYQNVAAVSGRPMVPPGTVGVTDVATPGCVRGVALVGDNDSAWQWADAVVSGRASET